MSDNAAIKRVECHTCMSIVEFKLAPLTFNILTFGAVRTE